MLYLLHISDSLILENGSGKTFESLLFFSAVFNPDAASISNSILLLDFEG